MTQSRKVILVVSVVCTLSVLATWNLIRKDQLTRTNDKQENDGVGLSSENQPSDAITVSRSDQSSSEVPATRAVGENISATSEQGVVEGSAGQVNAQSNERPGIVPGSLSEGDSGAPSDHSAAGENATKSPASSSMSASNSKSNASNGTDTSAKQTKYPGIEQKQDRVMIRDVRFKAGDGEDLITVSLIANDQDGEVAGRVWIIAEYVQRGTTGVMYMPSHNDLNLTADGKPQNPNTGLTFSMRFNTEKSFSIKRPGFEGEELTAIRVGVLDKKTGKLHMASMPIKQGSRKAPLKRAKVEVE